MCFGCEGLVMGIFAPFQRRRRGCDQTLQTGEPAAALLEGPNMRLLSAISQRYGRDTHDRHSDRLSRHSSSSLSGHTDRPLD